MLSDVVINPVFDEEEINRVKEQRITSIIQSKDDAGSLSDKLFNKVVFGNHPYAQPPDGTEKSVQSMLKSDIEGFYNSHYNKGNLILAFVGAISKDEALKIVNDKFSSLRGDILDYR